jgi:transcriptional antiterminator RfaH
MADGIHWYVVHTQALAEEKAAFNLRRQGFDVYLPRYLKRWRHARRVEKRPAPLFPRYLFVQLDMARARWRAISSTLGVARLVCAGERPAPVPPGIVEAIRGREDAGGLFPLREVPFRRGEAVRVVSGSLATAIGLFESLSDNDRVVLLLDLLGRKMRVALPIESVAALA